MTTREQWRVFFESLGESVSGSIKDVTDKFELTKAIAGGACKAATLDPRINNWSAYERGFYKGMCDQIGGDIPGSISFPPSVGQCPVAYFSEIEYLFEGNYVTREVGAWYGRYRRTEFNSTKDKILIIAGEPNSPDTQRVYEFLSTGNPSRPFTSFQVLRIFRIDGGLDNCGQPEPLPQPVSVTHIHEGDNAPTIYTYQPDNRPSSKFCFTAEGVRVCVSPDGIDITKIGEDGEDDSDWDGQSDKEEEEEEEKEEFEEKEVLDWVLVDITGETNKGTKILRADEKDSEIMAGYIAWEYNKDGKSGFLPAIPIRKAKNAFKAPDDIKGYSVYTNYELTATTTEVKKKIKVPKEPPS